MNRLSLSVFSFLLGSVCTMLVLRLGAVDLASADGNPYVPIVPSIVAPDPVPIVPPPGGGASENNDFHGFGTLMLDGRISSHEVFDSADGTTIVYGGGAYRLDAAQFWGPVNFRFIGAAANTVKLLSDFHMLVANTAVSPLQLQKNKPLQNKINLKKPLKGDIASPYDGSPHP